MYLPYVTISSF